MRRSALWAARLAPAVVSLALIATFGTLSHSAPSTPTRAAGSPSAPASASAALPESYPWVRLAEAARPAVVNVRVKAERVAARGDEAIPESLRRLLPPGFRDRVPESPRGERRGLGSGFIVDASGYIVTNHHVVDGAQTIDVTLDNGKTLSGRVVGTDPETDLALLKVEATGLPTLPIGRSAELKVGEPVMAIGNPFGLDHTVTVGIISGTGRVIGAGRYDDFLQTDAAINPGNSGGPLINTRGQVIGIAAAIASRDGGFQGIGFAIPMDLAQPIVQQLRADGRVMRGWLGVSIQPITPELATSFGLNGREGALVASVSEGSPAAQAGMRPGDVIVRYDGKPVDGPRALSSLVAATASGRTVDVSVIRDSRAHPLRVTVAPLKDARRASATTESRGAPAGLGVEVESLTPETARRLGVTDPKGVVVTGVQPGSPAAEAGVVQGDVIREVNRLPVESADDVKRGIAKGQQKQVLLRLERDGGARYVVIQLG